MAAPTDHTFSNDNFEERNHLIGLIIKYSVSILDGGMVQDEWY